jgi:hypothetical protein
MHYLYIFTRFIFFQCVLVDIHAIQNIAVIPTNVKQWLGNGLCIPYINVRHQLGVEPKTIYNEICQVYGDNEVSYRHVRNWIAKFKTGLESIKDAVTPKNIKNFSIILETDARHTFRDIAKMVGISEGSVRTILKKKLEMSRITSRWIPHLPTDEQKQDRIRCAKKIVKNIPRI